MADASGGGRKPDEDVPETAPELPLGGLRSGRPRVGGVFVWLILAAAIFAVLALIISD